MLLALLLRLLVRVLPPVVIVAGVLAIVVVGSPAQSLAASASLDIVPLVASLVLIGAGTSLASAALSLIVPAAGRLVLVLLLLAAAVATATVVVGFADLLRPLVYLVGVVVPVLAGACAHGLRGAALSVGVVVSQSLSGLSGRLQHISLANSLPSYHAHVGHICQSKLLLSQLLLSGLREHPGAQESLLLDPHLEI